MLQQFIMRDQVFYLGILNQNRVIQNVIRLILLLVFAPFRQVLLLVMHGFKKIRNGIREQDLNKTKNFEYLWAVYNEVSILCNAYPSKGYNIMRGKKFLSVTFMTRQLPCLNELYYQFYTQETKCKSISIDLYGYLNYIVQAHWIMCDGSIRNKGLTLCTDNFSMKEVVQLISMLNYKFNINCTMHIEKKRYYRIYIKPTDYKAIIPKIKPYFVNSFYYKQHQ